MFKYLAFVIVSNVLITLFGEYSNIVVVVMCTNAYVNALTENLFELQQKGILCDIVIQLMDCQISAHRAVLAAASPSLCSLISSQMATVGWSAPVSQIIEMKSFRAADAKLWLQYVYTGKTSHPSSLKQCKDVLSLFELLGIQKPDWRIGSFEEASESELMPSEALLFNNTDSSQCIEKAAGYDSGVTAFDGKECRKRETEASSEKSLQLEPDAWYNNCTDRIADSAVSGGSPNSSHTCMHLDSCTTDVKQALLDNSSGVQNAFSVQLTHRNKCQIKKAYRHRVAKDQVYDCSYCGRTFFRKQSFKIHVKVHTEGRPHKCKVCGDSFRYPKTLARHAILFHRVSYCNICGSNCVCSTELDKENGKGAVQYFCNICNKSFVTQKSLAEHQLVHSDMVTKEFMCEICGKSFKRKGQLSLHQAVHSSKPYTCRFCSRIFVNYVQLEEHLRRHTGDRPIECDACGKRFHSRKTLKTHLDRHTGLSHQCDICGRHFSSRAYLLVHVDGHTNNRQRLHKCEVCSKAFFDKNCLRKHRYIHDKSRSRSFVCVICGKGFYSSSGLQSHVIFHRDERPYKCDVCGKGFKLKSHFRRHCRVHNNKGNIAEEHYIDDIATGQRGLSQY